MEKFDQYDEIEYTGKSNPNIWRVHLEFFYSKEAALKRYATIKRLHPEAAEKTAVRPFFRRNGETELHQHMIKDFSPETANRAPGVWQLEFWLPSTEQQAADFESKMSKEDPKGWAEHFQIGIADADRIASVVLSEERRQTREIGASQYSSVGEADSGFAVDRVPQLCTRKWIDVRRVLRERSRGSVVSAGVEGDVISEHVFLRSFET